MSNKLFHHKIWDNNLFLAAVHAKNEQFGKSFVTGYLDWLEERGKIVRITLEDTPYVFAASYWEEVMERIDSLAKSDVRVSRSKILAGIKEMFDANEQTMEALINIPETGIEAYTFADGAYYVHGINDDRIRVCSACGIAEVVTPDAAAETGSYFCSDYCRETDKECESLIQQLRNERFRKESIDAASFGGALHGILSSISYNKGNVAAQSFTGHGVAAENANTRIDKLMGRSAQVVGSDNAKNGADRIVNGWQIQSKYCQTAYESVNAAFTEQGKSVPYRYIDADGKAMQLEVPRNQYEEAIVEMRKKLLLSQIL